MSRILEYFKSFIWAPTETGEVLPQPSDTPGILFNVILPILPPDIIVTEPKPIEVYEEIVTVNFVKPPTLSPLDVAIPIRDIHQIETSNLHTSFIVHQ